ncbi:hypothetical protein HPB49_023993 [Dermacentor silvarum]|uniref:Uncharacterized protein n=1 Tax=Dermacentor silvarum TaxID=543639 RepID=A0ACB8E3T9_DERSI|nr:hypothetical protein HPB49_023993 [Dermacentor silvarum]
MRCELGLAKFEPSLCSKRWLAEHYIRSRRVLLPDEHQMPEPLQIDKVEKWPILSSHQKYRKAAAVAGKIASTVSEVAMPKFQERLGILEALLRHWSLDEDILISMKQVTADGEIDDPCLKPEDIEGQGKSSTAACTLSSADDVCTSCETAVISGKKTIPPAVATTNSPEQLAHFNAKEANASTASTSAALEAAASMPCETLRITSGQDIIPLNAIEIETHAEELNSNFYRHPSSS